VSAERGTGRTTRQMLTAARGSIFVWCNDVLHYPRELARFLGREDLTIVGASSIRDSSLRGTCVVVDHWISER